MKVNLHQSGYPRQTIDELQPVSQKARYQSNRIFEKRWLSDHRVLGSGMGYLHGIVEFMITGYQGWDGGMGDNSGNAFLSGDKFTFW